MESLDKKKLNDLEIEERDVIEDIALLFKMFADPTRLRILQVLMNRELNVYEISFSLNMSQSAISHQLATLKMANLVKSNKVGKEVYYSLADEHVRKIISMGKEHIMEE